MRTAALPLRAEQQTDATSRRRLQLRLRTATVSSQLADTAWRARELVEPGPLRQPLTDLAALLFEADRAVHGADALLGKVDRRRIARRLSEQQQLSLVSAPVAELAAGTDAKHASLDLLSEDRQVVSDLGAETAALLGRSFTAHAIQQMHERLALATSTLDAQVTVTARSHDAQSCHLARTRWRGVYRLDGLYVVPYHDDLGITPTRVRRRLRGQAIPRHRQGRSARQKATRIVCSRCVWLENQPGQRVQEALSSGLEPTSACTTTTSDAAGGFHTQPLNPDGGADRSLPIVGESARSTML